MRELKETSLTYWEVQWAPLQEKPHCRTKISLPVPESTQLWTSFPDPQIPAWPSAWAAGTSHLSPPLQYFLNTCVKRGPRYLWMMERT